MTFAEFKAALQSVSPAQGECLRMMFDLRFATAWEVVQEGEVMCRVLGDCVVVQLSLDDKARVVL